MRFIKLLNLVIVLLIFTTCAKNTIDDIDERIIWFEFDCNDHAHVESYYTEMQNYNPVISEKVLTFDDLVKFIKEEKKKKKFEKNMKAPYYKASFLETVAEIKVFTDDERFNFIQTYYYENGKLVKIEKTVGRITYITQLKYTDELSIIKHIELIDDVQIASIERDVIRDVVLKTSRVTNHDELLNKAFEDWGSDKTESKFMQYGTCP